MIGPSDLELDGLLIALVLFMLGTAGFLWAFMPSKRTKRDDADE